ncbi:hypothetical protein SAMN05421874_12848 [Nonomuraea maritima]|uniref:Uncharacterized protein n=1 Tax=Nonomuraea maritima TaxID=683260 RepID=A0A1G9MJQ8_9ACTN|nr:hypothetical protein [Nonomuraea maritima]SDL73875.1 hypothetical protein SAMN05421874_12848 [Nonomuraea maritima]
MNHAEGGPPNPAAPDFTFQHSVHVIGFSPDELRRRALHEAARFFGDDAELHVVSAESEPDPEYDGRYKATVVFRQVEL